MTHRAIPYLAAVAGWVLASAAMAAKPPLYDDFNGGNGLDRSKWFDAEMGLFVEGKQLRVGRYTYGGTSADTGLALETFGQTLLDTTVPKALSADITVSDMRWLEGCASNPLPSRAAARLIAAFFNGRVGGPLPGDRTGDVLAQVRLVRGTDSTLPAGQVQVQGVVSRCTVADCNSSAAIGIVDFGTVAFNTAVNGRIDWVKKSKSFKFTVGGVTQNVVYTDTDSVGPVRAFTQVSARNEAANCLSGPKTKAGVEALFDNVRVGY